MPDSILAKVIASQEGKEVEHIPWGDLKKLIEASLASKEQSMVSMRYGLDGHEPKTLEEIGKIFQLTRERVRQIIKLAQKKVKAALPRHDVYRKVMHVVIVELEKFGGVLPHEKLIRILAKQEDQQRLLSFLLEETVIEGVERVSHHPTLRDAWKLGQISLDPFAELGREVVELVKREGGKHIDVLFEKFSTNESFLHIVSLALHPTPSKEIFQNILELSKELQSNVLGLWGVESDPLVVPKRVSDKIYLVLRHHNKPMHFRDITTAINDTRFDHKRAYLPTIHNELILDPRFVLVGRGMYALTEWGYVRGVVADVIEQVLRTHGPLTRAEIEAEVLKQRIVKAGTIYLSLTNKKRFLKNKQDGRYYLVQHPGS